MSHRNCRQHSRYTYFALSELNDKTRGAFWLGYHVSMQGLQRELNPYEAYDHTGCWSVTLRDTWINGYECYISDQEFYLARKKLRDERKRSEQEVAV